MRLGTTKLRIQDLEGQLKTTPYDSKFSRFKAVLTPEPSITNTSIHKYRKWLIKEWSLECRTYHELSKIKKGE